MWNTPSKEQLAEIPSLYETEHIPVKDKLIYLHFFFGGIDWYVAEFDGRDTFFGLVINKRDNVKAEWGYFSFLELKQTNYLDEIEVYCEGSWQVRTSYEVEQIRDALQWQ